MNGWGEGSGDEMMEGRKKLWGGDGFVKEKGMGCMGGWYGGFMRM